MANSKPCIKCGADLPLSEFYAHKGMADGHLNKCKPCIIQYTRDRREANDSVREYDRARSRLPHRKARSAAIVKKYRADNPARYHANTAVGNAVRDGRLKKGACFFCRSTVGIHAHHADYSKPLDVKWLCVRCHRRLHAIAPEHVHG